MKAEKKIKKPGLIGNQNAKGKATGRHPILKADEETIKKIHNLAKLQCTEVEAAGFLEVSQPTLNRFLNSNKNAHQAWANGVQLGRVSLRRQQFKLAETNVAMSIWLGKQYLEQNDKAQHEHSGPGGGPIPYHKIERVVVDPKPIPEDVEGS